MRSLRGAGHPAWRHPAPPRMLWPVCPKDRRRQRRREQPLQNDLRRLAGDSGKSEHETVPLSVSPGRLLSSARAYACSGGDGMLASIPWRLILWVIAGLCALYFLGWEAFWPAKARAPVADERRRRPGSCGAVEPCNGSGRAWRNDQPCAAAFLCGAWHPWRGACGRAATVSMTAGGEKETCAASCKLPTDG